MRCELISQFLRDMELELTMAKMQRDLGLFRILRGDQ